jgi:hypothetical protein
MGIVANFFDALRRLGSPTMKSALKRQDAQLIGREVLERRQEHIDGPFGKAHIISAKVEPVKESVEILSEDAIRPLNENVLFGASFLQAFGIEDNHDWTLTDLDNAFEAWILASDKLGYTDNAVMEILGAMFGHYCTVNLNMRWIKLTDADGSTLAVDGIDREFRGFPFQTISKRIEDREYGFFTPVFALLAANSEKASLRSVPG